jgi:hypothetical protein
MAPPERQVSPNSSAVLLWSRSEPMEKRLRTTTIIPEKLYVERGADRQLAQIIEDMGRPGYVLVARQMGKTNLLINCKRLRERKGELVTYFDLSNRFDTARALFRRIIDGVIEADPETFASVEASILTERKQELFEPAVEYDRHLRRLLTSATHPRIIIVLDEIDSLVSVPYSDTILAQVRSMYFSRINHAVYGKLTYVLSGVAEPTDLIKDKNISPFNIGEKIYLDDFSRDEIKELADKAGLDLASNLLDAVAHWTGGNPRMVWDLCSAIEDQVLGGGQVTPASIRAAVEHLFLAAFDRAPVDHIRVLASSDPQIRDAITAIRMGNGVSLDEKIKSRLYLAGIIGSVAKHPITIKSGIIDAALSDTWLLRVAAGRRSLLQAASDNYAAGRFPQAIRGFEALENDGVELGLPGTVEFALALNKTGDFARSAAYLQRALQAPELGEKNGELRYYLATALIQTDRVSEGIAELIDALEQDLEPALKKRAQLALSTGYYSTDEEADYKRGLTMSLALVEELRGTIEAEQFAEDKVLFGYALFNAAKGYSLTGDSKASRAFLNEALQFAPLSGHPYVILYGLHLADTPALRGEIANAAARVIIENRLPLNDGPPDALAFNRATLALALAAALEFADQNTFNELLDYAQNVVAPAAPNPFLLLCDLFEAGEKVGRSGTIGLVNLALREHSDLADDDALLTALGWAARYSVREQKIAALDRFVTKWLEVAPPKSIREDYLGLVLAHIGRLIKVDEVARLEPIFGAIRAMSPQLSEQFPVLNFVFLYQERTFRVMVGDQAAARRVAEAVVAAGKELLLQKVQHEFVDTVKEIVTQAEQDLRSPSLNPFRHIGRNTRVSVRDVARNVVLSKKFKLVEMQLRSGEYELVSVERSK